MAQRGRNRKRAESPAAPLLTGLVTAAYGRRYRVELDSREEVDCMTRGKKSDLACGDRVAVARSGMGVGVIESIEARRTLFYRSDSRREKLIAANVTQIGIVVAVQPRFNEDLIDRCLVGAEHARISAMVLLNKSDLPDAQSASDALTVYRQLGYTIVPLEAKRDLSPLHRHLARHVTVLVGQSGVGKSTIVNGLAPHAAMRVGELSAALGTGRHTTTHAALYHLDPTSAIIDSPGLQEFGLHHLSPQDAAHAFIEFRRWLGRCRFRDCLHMSEPECAVAQAADCGYIAPQRLATYRRLAAELAGKRAAWET
jgi:ribosome biogenesis GTPase